MISLLNLWFIVLDTLASLDVWWSRWLYQDYELMDLLLLYPVWVD